MSRKRRNTSSAEPESPRAKRRQSSGLDGAIESSSKYEHPQTNALTGLTAAFPGLDDNDTHFYGPARDGLEYLRMVRTEANGIPSFLSAPTAPHENTHEIRDEDYDGFYDDDEAFIAPPIVAREEALRLSRTEDLCYQALLEQFERIRGTLQSTPPLSAIKALSESIPISFPASSKHARQMWEAYITQHAANPVQVACMDTDSVFELVRLITKKMRRFFQPSDEEYVRRIGTWIWAMLAKCPDRGQLGSEEISDLRACARAADMTWQWLQDRTHSVVVEAYIDDEDEDFNDERRSDAENIEGDKDRHTQKLDGVGEPRTSSGQIVTKQRIILAMVVTVVGETYGQRDLLELRRRWVVGDGG